MGSSETEKFVKKSVATYHKIQPKEELEVEQLHVWSPTFNLERFFVDLVLSHLPRDV